MRLNNAQLLWCEQLGAKCWTTLWQVQHIHALFSHCGLDSSHCDSFTGVMSPQTTLMSVCVTQEAVEKLLQRSEALCGDTDHELDDKEFFSFTYGRLLSQSFSWLPAMSNTVHPMPDSPSKSAARHSLRLGSIGSNTLQKLPVLSKITSTMRSHIPSETWSIQNFGLLSKALSRHKLSMQSMQPSVPARPEDSNDELSMHSVGLSSPKHRLPARRASILKLIFGNADPELHHHTACSASPSALSLSALRCDLGKPPSSTLGQRGSWLNLSQNSVHPLPDQNLAQGDTESSHPQRASSKRNTLRFGALDSPLATEKPAGDANGLLASPMSPITRTKSILRSKSSLTAVSMFHNALDVSSSEDDSSQTVPDDLIESALFLLRDRTLADPQAQVSCIASYSTA